MSAAPDLFAAYEKAQTLLASGELRQAADACRAMLDSDPAFPHGYHLMSSLFKATGTYNKALDFAQIAIRLQPDVAAFHTQRGQVLLAIHDWAAAAAAFEQANRLEPNDPAPLLAWGRACMEQEHFAQALALFDRARSLGSGPEADEREGLCRYRQGDGDAAERLFDKLIAGHPGRESAHIYKGRLWLEKNILAAAEGCFARALKLNQASWEALYGMALLAERQNQSDLAIRYALQAVQARPQEAAGHRLLGDLLLQQQQYETAEQVLRQAVALKPEQVHGMQMLLESLMQQHKGDEGLPLLGAQAGSGTAQAAMRHFRAMLRGEQPDAAPQDYIAGIFDGQAEQFDYREHVAAYTLPDQIASAVGALPFMQAGPAIRLLDLGCGTGLGAQAFSEFAGYRAGVDLSGTMLRKARGKRLYHALYRQDMVEFMRGASRQFNLVLAADALSHCGNLEPFFGAARRVIAPGGLIAFSVETAPGHAPWRLLPDGRFIHSQRYIEELLRNEGYREVVQEAVILRMRQFTPITGMFCIAAKAPTH